MTIEIRPVGVSCNLRCTYCYQNTQRQVPKEKLDRSFERVLEEARRQNKPFAVFGGEALLLPLPELEYLLQQGFEMFGRSSVQTNGTLITKRHVDLFQRCNVSVGISVDGPGELNDARWVGNLEKTRIHTQRTETSITMLLDAGLVPGLIVTLHRINASPSRLPKLLDLFRYLDSLGIRRVRLHNLEVDAPEVARDLLLDHDDCIDAFTALHSLEKELSGLKFDIFDDIRQLLLANDNSASCVWKACDPYTTPAVQGIEIDGRASNCDRTNKRGVSFVKSDEERFERSLALYHTPQEFGGCAECRFFAQCKGQCPGTGIDGDWRNRSADCRLWKALFALCEDELVESMEIPLSLSSLRSAVESILVESWARGANMPLAAAHEIAVGCRSQAIRSSAGDLG